MQAIIGLVVADMCGFSEITEAGIHSKPVEMGTSGEDTLKMCCPTKPKRTKRNEDVGRACRE